MHQFQTDTLKVLIRIFLVSTILGTGLDLTQRQVLERLRNARLMITVTVVLMLIIVLPTAPCAWAPHISSLTSLPDSAEKDSPDREVTGS